MPSDPREAGVEDEAFWREFLTEGHRGERAARRLLKHLPDSPRCKACAAPFAGLGAPVMRAVGKGPSKSNPNLCDSCFSYMRKHRGGAEIEISLLFADVRGSTTLAERMTTTEYHALMERFYRVAARAVFGNDGGVDKFVGDEVMAMFFPLASGEAHPAKAIAAAKDLLLATGHGDPSGPWLPMGAGVHTGPAWVGALGDETHVELTALGDAVNVAARLAAAAGPGEIIVSMAAARLAHIEGGLDRRTLELKGKVDPIEVVILRVGRDG